MSSKKINIEPENRNVSLAFQENSLFPHYDVKKNILLGTERNKGKKKQSINFEELIDLLDIFIRLVCSSFMLWRTLSSLLVSE